MTAVQADVELYTHTGSVYRVTRNKRERWWMRAANVANPTSRPLNPGRWWIIQRPCPWPPELGQPIALRAPGWLARDDPARIPGGGKITSPIRAIRRRP